MAYSNVGTPVFYVDNYIYHKTIGALPSSTLTVNEPNKEIYTMNPAIPKSVTLIEGTYQSAWLEPDGSTEAVYDGTNWIYRIAPNAQMDGYQYTENIKFYLAFLNHNNNGGQLEMESLSPLSFEEVLNGQKDGSVFHPHNGSTILVGTFLAPFYQQISFTTPSITQIGALSSGIQYTMPQSPDLELNMDIEFDGVKNITTSGGSDLANIRYTGNPLWINGANKTNPFEVYEDPINALGYPGENVSGMYFSGKRNGRRSWSLKFSYIADTDLFSSNINASYYTEHPNDSTYSNSDLNPDGGASDGQLNESIHTDDSFYAQVWNKTLGGALPFIFQPDSNFRDEFYICKFDQKSLKVEQSAYKVYDISLKIVEVW